MLALTSLEKSITNLSEDQLLIETLADLTRDLDEVMSENNSRKLKRNYSLNKLTQQEIEELILREHENELNLAYNDSGERTTKRSRQITPSLEDSIEQDWDAQLEEICSMNSSGHFGVSSLENEIVSARVASATEYDSMRASKIEYDYTEEELLRSIESDFGGALEPSHDTEGVSPKPEKPNSPEEFATGLTQNYRRESDQYSDLPPLYSP